MQKQQDFCLEKTRENIRHNRIKANAPLKGEEKLFKILLECEENDKENKRVFPDFVKGENFVEHFEVSFSKERSGKGYDFKRDRQEAKKKHQEKIAKKIEEADFSKKEIILINEKTEWSCETLDKNNFDINTLKRIKEHIESMEKSERKFSGVKVFLMDYTRECGCVTEYKYETDKKYIETIKYLKTSEEKNNFIEGARKQIEAFIGNPFDYYLILDKKLLKEIYEITHGKIDYIVFTNKNDTEIIKIDAIPGFLKTFGGEFDFRIDCKPRFLIAETAIKVGEIEETDGKTTVNYFLFPQIKRKR